MTIDKESADAIVAGAMKTRSDLAELDQTIQGQIDEIVLGAARQGRDLSPAELDQRKKLRGDQADVQDAFAALAFATLRRLDNSADVADLKTKLDAINAGLTTDLNRLKAIARYAAIAAKVADGLAQLASKVTAVAALV
jgi:hypothetical protein